MPRLSGDGAPGRLRQGRHWRPRPLAGSSRRLPKPPANGVTPWTVVRQRNRSWKTLPPRRSRPRGKVASRPRTSCTRRLPQVLARCIEDSAPRPRRHSVCARTIASVLPGRVIRPRWSLRYGGGSMRRNTHLWPGSRSSPWATARLSRPRRDTGRGYPPVVPAVRWPRSSAASASDTAAGSELLRPER